MKYKYYKGFFLVKNKGRLVDDDKLYSFGVL